jgi:hypothetical protein
VHLPCALYGVAIEAFGWLCPLTPLENRLRALGGAQGYTGSFVEHYLLPIIYPNALTPTLQGGLAFAVALANALTYAWAILPAARQARR